MAASEQNVPDHTGRRPSFMDYGGPNSLNNFASSLQRASTYLEVTLPESSSPLDNISPCTSRGSTDVRDIESGLLCPENTAASNVEYGSISSTKPSAAGPGGKPGPRTDLNNFQFPGHEDYEASESTPLSSARRRRESSLFPSGKGRSTAPQTVFNAVNTLMGVAMLSLPFGLRLSGWIPGIFILVMCSWITSFTAKALGSVLRKHKHVYSYADIAYLFGGSKFLAFATFTFVLDLTGASLSLILIFSDSFSTLLPHIHTNVFKLAITGVTLVFSFLPLSLVSIISLIGIICTVGIFATIVFCGVISSNSPGSLLHPAATTLWPSTYKDLLLSLGIFMAPWGGHPVFPELYRDMRHPSKYNRSCTVTFSATIFLDLLIAAVGYLMFGGAAEDSVTKNIIANAEYPNWIRTAVCVFLGLLPVCKLALVTRPVISVYESHFALAEKRSASSPASAKLTLRQCLARVVFMAFLFALSVAFTSFGKVVAFLGSAICFTICVTLPLLFHLKLNADELTPFTRATTRAGVAIGILGAVLGTYGSLASRA